MANAAKSMYERIQALSEAMIDGQLSERCDTTGCNAQDAALLELINRMLDTLIQPMRLATSALQEIAHGNLPAFVIDEYKGEYNDIKTGINTLLAVLYGMHLETKNLTDSVSHGNLRIRGNDWDYDGIWQDLIAGVNKTLDAVVTPIDEASVVLGKLADYDLSARMRGKYYGDHAAIRKALNTTADSLHDAVSQVAETVDLVTSAGQRIAEASKTVSTGAIEQQAQLEETTKNLESITANSQHCQEKTHNAKAQADEASASIDAAREAMDRMAQAMIEIRASADGTATIVGDINTIANETGSLSESAHQRATKVASSAGGFGVVANEIQTLSKQCNDSAMLMQDFQKRLLEAKTQEDHESLQKDLRNAISELRNISVSSKLLGLNAAVEGAHVEGAGKAFQDLTSEISGLAERATDAAKQTDSLIRSSVEMAAKGEELSQEIVTELSNAVKGADVMNKLTADLVEASYHQAQQIEQILTAVEFIRKVTQSNSSSSLESTQAASDLEQQVAKLSLMVERFNLQEAA